MGKPIRNPFYWLLLIACGALLVTIFVSLVGWYNLPALTDPDPKPPLTLPPWMIWIDRHSVLLIAGEVVAIVLLSILTIGLDRFFDKPDPPPT